MNQVMVNYVLIECYSDEQFLLSLIPEHKKLIRHGTNKSEILKRLDHNFESCIGIIDLDKNFDIAFLQNKFQYQEIAEFFESNELFHKFYSKAKTDYIFTTVFNLEQTILTLCQKYHIKLNDFQLPNIEKELHDLSTPQNSKKFIKLFDYFKDIPEIKQMAKEMREILSC